jgi:transposase
MAFAKPYTQRERDFVRAHWQEMTRKELAEKLGRSERSVYKVIADMHLREESGSERSESGKKRPTCTVAASNPGTLEELRSLLWSALQEASPRDIPRLSQEYREVLNELKAGEHGEHVDDGTADDPLVERLRLVSGG